MAITLTTDFNSIQERHIDPFSPVDSDNTSMLLKALGKEKCVTYGFDINLLENDTSDPPDGIADGVVVSLSPGILIKDYIVIQYKDTVYLKLFDIGDAVHEGDRKYVVLEYKYQKINPPPISTLKVIDPSDYDSSRHLILYMIEFNYDAGSDPVNLDYITVYDKRFTYCSDYKTRFETVIYVGGANASLQFNELFPLEYHQATDITLGNYLIYPEIYVTDDGSAIVIVNFMFIGHDMEITALDFATTSYSSGEYCSCTDPYTRVVNHNLNNTYNIVGVFWKDQALDRWSMVMPDNIHYVNANTLEVTTSGFTGETMMIKVYVPDYDENVVPDVGNDTFTITHNLGKQYPIVQAVDLNTNQVVIPETIRFIDSNRLEVKFGSSIYTHPVKILVKEGNEYYLTLTDSSSQIIYHNLGVRPLDWVQVIKLDEYWDVEPELITFLDENRVRIDFDDTVESWFWVSMGRVRNSCSCAG